MSLRASPLALAVMAGVTLFLGGGLSGWLFEQDGRTGLAFLVLAASVGLAVVLVILMIWTLARHEWRETRRRPAD
jgi:O-antigen/teichoic acid export membrane protein